MIYWKCPSCKRQRYYDPNENVLMKICYSCQIKMLMVEDKTLEAVFNGV